MNILKYLDENIEKILLMIILSIMCILIGLQIIFRYFLNFPLASTEEIARYFFIWLIYLAASLAIKKRRHLKDDAVMLLVGATGRFVLRIISNALCIFFCSIVSYYGVIITYRMQFVLPQVSPTLQIPMGLAYAAVPMGTILMFIRLIQDTALLVRERNKEKAESSMEILQ
jgi:TRAP-type C4-dicarboxylate transport system permease small subunit